MVVRGVIPGSPFERDQLGKISGLPNELASSEKRGALRNYSENLRFTEKQTRRLQTSIQKSAQTTLVSAKPPHAPAPRTKRFPVFAGPVRRAIRTKRLYRAKASPNGLGESQTLTAANIAVFRPDHGIQRPGYLEIRTSLAVSARMSVMWI
jgi:hypothetical protein